MVRKWPWWAWLNPWLFGRRISKHYDDMLEQIVWESPIRTEERKNTMYKEVIDG